MGRHAGIHAKGEKQQFGIKVGGNKFIEAQNKTQEDRLELLHNAMRLEYIATEASKEIADASARTQQTENYDIRIMRAKGREFDSQVAENIGAFKNDILAKSEILADPKKQEALQKHIEQVGAKFDPDIVKASREEEPERREFKSREHEKDNGLSLT